MEPSKILCLLFCCQVLDYNCLQAFKQVLVWREFYATEQKRNCWQKSFINAFVFLLKIPEQDWTSIYSCFKHIVTSIFIFCLFTQILLSQRNICDEVGFSTMEDEILIFQSLSSTTQIYHFGIALRVPARNSWSILFQKLLLTFH